MPEENKDLSSEWYERKENWRPQWDDARDGPAIDYGRIIHSASFRRLQGKTQILNLGDGDFYRTRLTHSIEVAQIAGSITRQLRKSASEHAACAYLPDLPLIQAIGATHDLGHPPFGHGGEVALNYCMRSHGGFEGNGQTLRILARLERFSENAGANLTRRTLLGVLKYPAPFARVRGQDAIPGLLSGTTTNQLLDRKASKPPKCYMDSEVDVVDWILEPIAAEQRDRFVEVIPPDGPGRHGKTQHKSFDCTIMDIADDIAFGVHDLEDALALRLMNEQDIRALLPETSCACFLDALKERYSGEFGNDVYGDFIRGLFIDGGRRKRLVGRLVGYFVTHCMIETDEHFANPLLRYRLTLPEPQMRFLDALKAAVHKKVVQSASVQHLEFKGQNMVVAVFEALASDPDSLLPETTLERYRESSDQERVICDHVAGMTDTFLLKTYERLFSPRIGSVFDPL